MKIKFRDITNQPKSNSMNINDEECEGMISRMMYAYQVYQTKGHDIESCTCHGCTYARHFRYFLGHFITKKLRRNW